MNFFSTIKLVFRTLLARKGRSFLTILGIVIGVGGVIVIIALGAGAQSLVLGQVNKLGSNLLSIQPGKSNENGPPIQAFGITITTLTKADADALENNSSLPHIAASTPLARGSVTVSWQNQTVDTNFLGSSYRLPEVISFTMKEGQFFNQQQDQGNANVVILGSTVADELFGQSQLDPVGQIIKVRSASQSSQNQPGGIPLRVIGVINAQGSSFFVNQDDMIYVPVAIGQQQILGTHYLQAIDVKVDSSDNITQTVTDLTNLMNQRHHVLKPTDQDFTIRNLADAISILTTVTSALSLFLTAMAAIALIVGGVGILNIMLVTVAERTREIGLRKAVGASNGAILRQFLLESGTLTSLGGIVGIIGGTLVSFLVSLLMHALGYDWAFRISIISVILAVGVSVLTGVIFGLYPAFKAAKLNPIEALRYE